MNFRQMVTDLTDMSPVTRRLAIEELRAHDSDSVEAFARYLGELLATGPRRTMALWAIGSLTAAWRDDVELAISRGDSPAKVAWPCIQMVRDECLTQLFEIRRSWFGWSEWDDCLILGPLAASRIDPLFERGRRTVTELAESPGPSASDAGELALRWFGRAELDGRLRQASDRGWANAGVEPGVRVVA